MRPLSNCGVQEAIARMRASFLSARRGIKTFVLTLYLYLYLYLVLFLPSGLLATTSRVASILLAGCFHFASGLLATKNRSFS